MASKKLVDAEGSKLSRTPESRLGRLPGLTGVHGRSGAEQDIPAVSRATWRG